MQHQEIMNLANEALRGRGLTNLEVAFERRPEVQGDGLLAELKREHISAFVIHVKVPYLLIFTSATDCERIDLTSAPSIGQCESQLRAPGLHCDYPVARVCAGAEA